MTWRMASMAVDRHPDGGRHVGGPDHGARRADYRWVQVFENRGAEMGASSPHPHGQIWAGSALPTDAAREDATQRAYAAAAPARGCCLTMPPRSRAGRRVVEEDARLAGGGAVLGGLAVRDAASCRWPRRPAWPTSTPVRRDSLAAVLSRLLQRYDALFQRPFPYSMGWHQAPFVSSATDHWQLHAHVLPPLLAPERAQVHGRATSCWPSRSGTSPRRTLRPSCATRLPGSGEATGELAAVPAAPAADRRTGRMTAGVDAAGYVLALDQGTTSSRAILFDRAGRPVATAQREITQHSPRPGTSSTTREEIWAVPARRRAGGHGGRRRRGRGHRGHRHHQPARDDHRVGPRDRACPWRPPSCGRAASRRLAARRSGRPATSSVSGR